MRNSFRYAGRQHRDAIVRSLKPVYTAPSEAATKDRFAEFAAEWGTDIRRSSSSGAIVGRSIVPFLEYDARDPPGDLHHQRDLCRSTSVTAGP
ncbi:transposase [Arachnia rubra]|uniref:transposase n=1 Tax=Arachnia rubra TaxID=1547448 RepID=UPI001CC6A5A0